MGPVGHTRDSMDFFWLAATVGVFGGLVWYAFRIEPHWVSKDGRRCICRGQRIDHHGATQDRWREYRADVLDDGVVSVRRRSLVSRGPGALFRVVSRGPDATRKRAVFVLRGYDNPDAYVLLRMPASSAAVPVLDSVTLQ